MPRPHQGRVLEVGCGTGGLMQKLAQRGLHVTGIDFSSEAVEFTAARRAGPVARASANELPFADESFDFVTCVDLLEVATVQPEALVENALRVLRPGGYGLFVMAAHQWLLSEHDRAVNSIRRFNLTQLRNLFAGKTARVLRGTYLFFLVFPLVVLRKLGNKPLTGHISTSDVSVPPQAVNLPLYWLCWLENQLLRTANLPMGSSVVVVVQKNG
ncbi:MAG: class I SAM-dependent methyltransferase [Anaerolineales bacterium]|nr:MAG: class I SAM-dependent methyltransferase [Anaerolineales bacterium]